MEKKSAPFFYKSASVKKVTDFSGNSINFSLITGLTLTISGIPSGADALLALNSLSQNSLAAGQWWAVDFFIDGVGVGHAAYGSIFLYNNTASPQNAGNASILVKGLTAGSHTFEVKYRSSNGSDSITFPCSTIPAFFSVVVTK